MNVCRISHRKWRQSKQQLIRLLDLTLPGCILVSFHILCDILQTFTVVSCDFTRWRNSSLTFPLLLPETDGARACFTDLAFAWPVAAAGN